MSSKPDRVAPKGPGRRPDLDIHPARSYSTACATSPSQKIARTVSDPRCSAVSLHRMMNVRDDWLLTVAWRNHDCLPGS